TGTVPYRPGPAMDVLDKSDYSLDYSLDVASVEVRSKTNDLVKWPLITTDLYGQPLTAASVDQLQLFEILYPADQVSAHIATDDLGFDLISTWTDDVSGVTFTNVNDLVDNGQPFDAASYFVQNNDKTWVAALTDVDDVDGTLHIKAMLSLLPTDGPTA